MPVSAIVLTPVGDHGALAAKLADDPRLTIGAAAGTHLPVVLEAASLEESGAIVESLLEREDVLFVDVVSVDFSDLVDLPELEAAAPCAPELA